MTTKKYKSRILTRTKKHQHNNNSYQNTKQLCMCVCFGLNVLPGQASVAPPEDKWSLSGAIFVRLGRPSLLLYLHVRVLKCDQD